MQVDTLIQKLEKFRDIDHYDEVFVKFPFLDDWDSTITVKQLISSPVSEVNISASQEHDSLIILFDFDALIE